MTKTFTFGTVTGAGFVTPATPSPRPVRVGTKLSEPELERMREGTADLLAILSVSRPDQTQAECDFVRDFVDSIEGWGLAVEQDGFGNRWVTVDDPDVRPLYPNILWSCHTDTVARHGGPQGVRFRDDGVTLELKKRKPGRCLGADDGAGVWLLREMIRAGVPGTYVFHRAEEVGRLGSKWVSDNLGHKLSGFDACVAFDRKGTDNLITHQMGQRGISKAFGDSFIGALSEASEGALKYVHDDTGSYTDSYSYFDTIPECCNVSVGYYGEHGPNETLDVGHLWRLRCALVRAEFAALAIERDPTVKEWSWGDDGDWDGFGWPKSYRAERYGSGVYSGNMGKVAKLSDYRGSGGLDDTELADIASKRLSVLCREFPDVAASLLEQVGMDANDFAQEMGVSIGDIVADGYDCDDADLARAGAWDYADERTSAYGN